MNLNREYLDIVDGGQIPKHVIVVAIDSSDLVMRSIRFTLHSKHQKIDHAVPAGLKQAGSVQFSPV